MHHTNWERQPMIKHKLVSLDGKRSGFELLFASTFPSLFTSRFPSICVCVFTFIVFVGATRSVAQSVAQESRSSGWVVIPVAEYRSLHSKAYPVESEPETSPVAATLTRVDYDLQV